MPTPVATPPGAPAARASPIREVTETFTVHESSTGLGTVTGVLSRGNVVNENHRYYPTHVLAQAAELAKDDIAAGKLVGLLDHPGWEDGNKGRPERIAIKWTELRMDGDDLVGDGVIVATTAGKEVAALKDAGVALGLSTNGYADVTRFVPETDLDPDGDPENLVMVVESLRLLTIDVVNDPGNAAAWVRKESLDRIAHESRKDPRMTLEELMNDHPALVAKIREQALADLTPDALKTARPDLIPPPAPSGDGDTALEQRVVALEAEKQRSEAEFHKMQREGIAREMLASADLPKLGKSGDIDLDARFGHQVDAVAKAAETADAARSSVAALIEERRALIGVTTPTRNTPGIPRRESHGSPTQNSHDGLSRARAGLGV